MRKMGLSPKRTQIIKSNSLKLRVSPSYKRDTKIQRQKTIDIFNKSFKKKSNNSNEENNNNLLKANNKILKIISSCMEKIQDEKNSEGSITPHLAGIIEKSRHNKLHKNHLNKKVTFNNVIHDNSSENNHLNRKFTKKSQITKNSSNKYHVTTSHRSSNKICSEHLERNNTIVSRSYSRIKTISKFAKEKEKEIVYNISSSLISLYNPLRQNSKHNHLKIIDQDKNKVNIAQQRRFSFNIKYKSKKPKKNNSKKLSKDDYFLSSLSNDFQTNKKNHPVKLKRFLTCIKPIKNKNKIKLIKNKNSNKNLKDFLSLKKNESLAGTINLGKNRSYRNNLEEDLKSSEMDSLNPSNWTNILKNREDLTQGEYIHIEQSLRQSLIDYNKNELEKDMKNIESTETTNMVRRLPTMKFKNNGISSPSSKEKLGKNTLININVDLEELNMNQNLKIDKEKFRLLQHTGYVYDSLDDEEVEDAIDINLYYIKPDSFFIYFFDSIIVISSFYILIFLPYYLAHDSIINASYLNIKIILFYIVDIFYIIDFIISFFRSYYNYEEILIKNVYDMIIHYIKNWFLLDLLAAIPFYSILFFLEKKNLKTKYFSHYAIKHNSYKNIGVKMNNIHYLLLTTKLLKTFKCFSDNNRALSKLLNLLFKSDFIEEKSDIILAIFIFVVSTNFGTCIFIFLGKNVYPSWINTMKLENESFSNIYICSLYYLVTTITTVGYGDISGNSIQEIIFQIILLIIGTCAYSYLLTSASNFIKKENKKTIVFENKLKILKEIKLSNPHLQDTLYDKVLRFIRYKKNTEKNKQTIIINSLPYSLRNSLIIEMYKPIINNFVIFKGLENSNCIVQLVTAFKPIYSIKNDILFQEGDFIEEVIFVKTGVVSLEIGIDLNKPKESIIAYLKKITDRDKIFIDHDSEILNYLTLGTTSTFMNNINSIQKDIFENKSRHNLKVLDIRKNEHFGETLMFLNERTFLTAKVKSKKAELFFLKKEEVIKIFSNFPNIWNRINKKSIYNMRQIKITVRKVLLNFCSMCGIQIYNDINEVNRKKSIFITKNKLTKKNKDKGVKNLAEYEKNKIIELPNKEDKINFSSIIKNANPINEEKQIYSPSKFRKNQNKEILDDTNKNNQSSSKSFDLDRSNNEFLSNYSKDNNSLKFSSNIKSNHFSQTGSNINNIKYSNENKSSNKKRINIGFSLFKEIKNQSFTEISASDEHNNNKGQINNIDTNDNNISKDTIKIPLEKKAFSLIDSDSLEERKVLESNNHSGDFNVNDEIYRNEIFNLYCNYEYDYLKKEDKIRPNINDSTRIENLSKKILEKTWVKNLNKEKMNYLEKLLNKSNEKSSSFNLDSKRKMRKNSSSYSSDSKIYYSTNIESFEIQASYENLNEITNNKYIKDNALRNKTKEFLLKECISDNNKKIFGSKISSELVKSLVSEKKISLKTFRNVSKKISDDQINKSEILPNRNREKSQKISKRSSVPNIKFNNRTITGRKKNLNLDKKRQTLNSSNIDNFFEKKQKSLKNLSNNLLPNIKKAKNIKLQFKNGVNDDELNKSVGINEEKDLSFFDKYNINNMKNDHIMKQPTIKRRKKQEDTELEEIKHIIKKDAQNLNEPSLYYQQLFFNQIQKKKNNNQTFLPIKRNKNNNNSINLDIKRTSTSKVTNNINLKFGFSIKKNNHRSSVSNINKNKKL